MKQFIVTPAMGKRLIAKAMLVHPAVSKVLKKGTLVIIAGTTNGYVAEEILSATGQSEGFSRMGFFRGLVTPPRGKSNTPKTEFAGDVVLIDGKRQESGTIFDVVDNLKCGDVILKGANTLDLQNLRAAVYIGDPKGGTAAASIQAVVGRRVQMIVPVGLEKRVCRRVEDLANLTNAPQAQGPRLLPLPGEVVTELQAVNLLTGGQAELIAGGGIYGAEGAVWLGVSGNEQQLREATELIESLYGEEPCQA